MLTIQAFSDLHDSFQGFIEKIIFPAVGLSKVQQREMRKAISIFALSVGIALGFDHDELLERLNLKLEEGGRKAMFEVVKMITEECGAETAPFREQVDMSNLTANDVFSAARVAVKTMLDMLNETTPNGQRYGDSALGQSTAGAIGILSTVCFVLSEQFDIPFEVLHAKLGLPDDIVERINSATVETRDNMKKDNNLETLRQLLEAGPFSKHGGDTKH